MANEVERLIRYIRKEDVVFFIGSGFSIKAGAPSVWKLIETLNKVVNTDLTKEASSTLRSITETFVEKYGDRQELLTILKDLFSFKPKDTSDQQMLVRIPHIHTIFTTNYDTLLEDTYPKEDREVITSNTGCAFTSNVPVHIYKVHGDINTLNDPDRIVITDSDYKEYFTNKQFEFIWKELQNAFVKKHVVFIGYSLGDDNILEIIKTVRDCIGQNMKQPFVIAPEFNDDKKARLKANRINYIDSKAEYILEAILASLNDNIVSDFRQKKVCKETYDRFCEINAGLYSTTTNKGKENSIDDIHVKEGKERQDNINFKVPFNVREIIEQGSFNDCIKINGTNVSIPAYGIMASEMQEFEYRINGIRLSTKDDITKLLIMPSLEQRSVCLKMPSIGFVEKVMSYQYLENHKIHIDIETPIYILKTSIMQNSSNKYTMNIDVDFHDTYKSNEEAIKWIEMLIGLYSHKELKINGFGITIEKMEATVAVFELYKEYYQTIKSIECETKINFDYYNNYAEENLRYAKYILHYYNGTNFSTKLHNACVTFTIDSRDETNIPIDKFKNDKFVIVESKLLGDIKLNGQTFTIPYVNTVFMDCSAKEVRTIDEYHYEIVMEDQEVAYVTWCSDKQPEQENNMLYLSNKKLAD
ncbi:SIR2 family NAD-dependent protein deacylase [Bacteroides zhangwenhongii]|uniref:SIR2 family NAD-dependent protein deacylase n=1 Tax=Bacteroides zhangwenhongii TaxID=2650157 RepID=UPI003AAF373D